MPSVVQRLEDVQICDCHLLVQAVLYLTAVVAGAVALVSLSIERVYFGGQCMLYGTVTSYNESAVYVYLHQQGSCQFALAVEGVTALAYSLVMTVYFFYAFKRSRSDIQIASQMWAMPFLLINTVLLFLVFIAACIISVGFKKFCDELVSATPLERCRDIQKETFNLHVESPDLIYDISPFYKIMTTAEVASWITVIIWIFQSLLTALRLYRNRKMRSSEALQDFVQPDA